MKTLFNNDWHFAEIAIDYNSMYKDNTPILFNPEQFYQESKKQDFKSVTLPHDWMISHVKELYKNSAGCYKKTFTLTAEEIKNRRISIHFESVYMNCTVWVNEKKAGDWKYGYSTFEYDITDLVKEGENLIEVIAVYQHCNTRWYSGAGIIRDVNLINSPSTFIPTDGTYIVTKCINNDLEKNTWNFSIKTEVAGSIQGHTVKNILSDNQGNIIASSSEAASPEKLPAEEADYLHKTVPSLEKYELSAATETFQINNPTLWDITNPYLYTLKTQLLDSNGKIIDEVIQNCGFKLSVFDKDKGYFLNGKNIKIYGACHHHDQGMLGAAFNKDALRRQFQKLQEMGVNSVRCSHNPPPKAWMDLADEMGILIDDEAFDMWEKPKTQFDYGNYFNDWYEKDVASWVRKDRNHACLIMWSIGNEIYDTHNGNGFEITKKLYECVRKHDPSASAPITIASNYMMSDGAQKCAEEIDTVGYNYLERLYDEHHKKYPEWKIYGSETSSTVQSRGIYHFPDTLKLLTFSDGQCSTLGNCTTTWGCESTQKVIANDRDCPFSAGQYIWTGWDYIGEPTPYHSKNSFFGQIDTAGFPKDTFYLYKSEWAYKNTKPFVHLLPYWDWNPGQLIDVKAYTNADSVELFFNGKSLGKQEINHINGEKPFGQWQLPYEKGELKAVGYDNTGNPIASEIKKSFGDPAKIVLQPENTGTENLHFIDIMLSDKDDTLVENARNYITVNVAGNGQLVGLDNGDSTDYEEYVSPNGVSHTRKLFSNRMLAIIRSKPAKNGNNSFVVTAASEELPNVSIKFDGKNWVEAAPYNSIHADEDFIPVRKIEIVCNGSTQLNQNNKELKVTAKVYPENATIKEINWNPVLKECVASDYIEVCDIQGKGTGTETATIKAVCDGECILRCTAKNGTQYDEVISDLGFTVTQIGNPKLNPYSLIEACRYSDWEKNSAHPDLSFEGGISNRRGRPGWLSYDKVDFGNEGADTVHIPFFSFDTEIPFEIWDGKPNDGGKCLGQFVYKHESVYNTYNENIFTLERRLFGVHTICIVLKTTLSFHGFYFDQTLKALSKLSALDANEIVGDSFTKTETAVEGIGNNVNLDFSNMNFDSESATKITICGKSNTENNTINLKFFGSNGENSTQVIEFSHTDSYEEKTFDIPPVTGNQRVSFVFLPGCNFDFKWFKFSK